MHAMRRVLLAASLIVLWGAGAVQGQTYPVRPVRVIVPNVPGGGLDIVARLLAPKLTESMGQTIVVDNRPGASGSIALELTARATPDGYNVMVFSANQVIYSALNRTSYDLFRDFAPITQIASAPYVFVVYAQLPAQSVSEFTAYAKANPAKVSYASSGAGSLQQLAAEHFAALAGLKLLHVPYKGIGGAIVDLVSGRVHMTMSSVTSMVPHIRQKRLRPLAVTSSARAPALPDVPTMIEAGVPGFEVTQWHGLHAPAGTPPRIIERLQGEVAKAVADPDVAKRLRADGTDPVGSPSRQFATFLRAEHQKWLKVSEQAGIRGQLR